MERIFSPAALDDLIAAPTARGDVSVLRGSAMLAVDCSSTRPDTRTSDVLRGLPIVTVGVGGHHRAFDVIVTDESALSILAAAVAANPQASVTLVQLLRLGDTLAPLDALVAESLAYSTLQGGSEFARWLGARGARVRRPEPHSPVDVLREGDQLRVVLNRPRVHNLYNAAMRDLLVESLVVAAADPALRVEISGAGRSFCAGGDLAEFGSVKDTATAHLIRSSANAAPYLLAIADRLSVNVHGACVGAGIELAAFASRVQATPDAFFQLPEVSMGLIPGAGGTVSITRRIGRQRTAWMALTGARVDASTALAWGLIDAID
ncbi:MAG TPA: enoyl-CoA hydratase/isomerase family protein [Acidimicrobiales bacterium]|nr:enoyl-CoA hydratase/isomerase family protein [Acidimicrobiales bacterium]